MKRFLWALVMVAGSGPASAQSLAWDTSPTELRGLFDAELSYEERGALASLIALPRRAGGGEQLVLAPIHESAVRLVGGNLIPTRFHQVRELLTELRGIPEYPMVAAYTRESAAVEYLAARLQKATGEERAFLAEKLGQAQERLKTFEQRVTQRTPTELEKALLKRAHLQVLAAGLQAPDIDAFIREWPRQLAGYLSQAYLELEFPVRAELSPSTVAVLRKLEGLYPDFRWYAGTVTHLHPLSPGGIPAEELGYRVTVERTPTGELVVKAGLMFHALEALVRQRQARQYIPAMFLGDVEGGGGAAGGVGLHSALCFDFALRSGGELELSTCKGKAESFWMPAEAPVATSGHAGRCDDAYAIGMAEGQELFRSLLPTAEVCRSEALETSFLEAFSVLAYLIQVGRFAPIPGMEGAQPCRLSGQNAGISETFLKTSLACAGADAP